MKQSKEKLERLDKELANYFDDKKETDLLSKAEVIAEQLVEHAKETARQMLLNTNLDVSKIPLICNKIVAIKEDLGEIKGIIKENYGDLNLRMTTVEKQQWKWIGILLIVPPIITILIAIIVSKLT